MKHLLITICALLAMAGSAAAQRVTPRPMTVKPYKAPTELTTNQRQSQQPKFTGYYFTTPSGDTLPVFQGSKGGLFVERVRKKTGKTYRQYLNDKQKAQIKKQL